MTAWPCQEKGVLDEGPPTEARLRRHQSDPGRHLLRHTAALASGNNQPVPPDAKQGGVKWEKGQTRQVVPA